MRAGASNRCWQTAERRRHEREGPLPSANCPEARSAEGSPMTGRVLRFDAAAHKVVDVLLPWFVNGTLEAEELALVQRHLGECPRCQQEVEWLRELHAACVAGEAMPGASAAFRKLRRQLEEPREGRDSIAGLRCSRSRARLWSRWAIAAQLAVIAVLGTLLLWSTD